MGIATDCSLAWGIAKAVHAHGAEVAVQMFQGEALLKRVRPLREQLGSEAGLRLDATELRQPGRAVRHDPGEVGPARLSGSRGGVADKEELKGRYINTSLRDLRVHDADILLLVHRPRPPGRAVDDRRRQPGDPD